MADGVRGGPHVTLVTRERRFLVKEAGRASGEIRPYTAISENRYSAGRTRTYNPSVNNLRYFQSSRCLNSVPGWHLRAWQRRSSVSLPIFSHSPRHNRCVTSGDNPVASCSP